jgi:hypothetical protein
MTVYPQFKSAMVFSWRLRLACTKCALKTGHSHPFQVAVQSQSKMRAIDTIIYELRAKTGVTGNFTIPPPRECNEMSEIIF